MKSLPSMGERNGHIVILIPGFAASEQDVNCLPMQQKFVLALQAAYPQTTIHIIAFEYPYHRKPYCWQGIPVTPLGGRNRGGLQRILLRKRAYEALRKIHQREKISGLLSFWTGLSAEVCTRFGRKQDIPRLNWIMGQDARPGNKYVQRNHYRPDELIALSDSLRDRYERSYGTKPAYVITPGCEMKTAALDSVPKPYRVIGAGSLIPLKRFDLFIEVIAEVRKKLPAVEAVIYGEGPLRETLQQQIDQIGLRAAVRLGGSIPHPLLMQKMQESRVLLHPSSFEGFSGVCLEARAAGIPVISYCQPMKDELPGWYTAPDKSSMIKMLMTELILPRETVPFDWHPMSGTVHRVMHVLGMAYNAVNASASLSAV